MSVILKIKCHFKGEVHRVLLGPDHLNYDSVIKAVESIHGGSNGNIKYFNANEVPCTLCQLSFSDFLSYAGNQDGKEVLKVEVFPAGANSNPADVPTSAFQAKHTPEIEEGYLLEHAEANASDCEDVEMGEKTAKGFGKGGFWKRSWRTKHQVAQLYKNGLLDGDSFSALFLTQLPQLMIHIAEHPEKAGNQLDAMLRAMPSLSEALHTLVTTTEGMQQHQALVEAWCNQQMATSEALLQLIPALTSLPFEAQHAFAKTLYLLNEDFLRAGIESFVASHTWMPVIPLVHEGIRCDGCFSSPIAGIRLKSTVRPCYNLCTSCFAKNDCFHDDETETHGFEAAVLPGGGCAQWWAALKSKGKGKGKWWAMWCEKERASGKGKGKGKWWAMKKGAGKHAPYSHAFIKASA
jgi:hypothetical protein